MIRVIRDTLALEGWDVAVREDGVSAIVEIEGAEAYDLIITDYELLGVNGVALARTARSARHRRLTPIFMFTANPVELVAREVGVESLMLRPEAIGRPRLFEVSLLPRPLVATEA